MLLGFEKLMLRALSVLKASLFKKKKGKRPLCSCQKCSGKIRMRMMSCRLVMKAAVGRGDPLMSLKHPGQPFSDVSVSRENRGPLMQHFSIACIDLL